MSLFCRTIELAAKAIYRVSVLGRKDGSHITRFSMYETLSCKKTAKSQADKVLSISGSQALAVHLGYGEKNIIDLKYPEYDMLKLPFANDSFDALVSDQVLEHVRGNPFDAVAESFRVVKSGGTVCHTSCLINPIHLYPDDYWRFTPEGLRLLVTDLGEIKEIGGWGNFGAWIFCRVGLRFEAIPSWRLHPARLLAVKNDPAWPIVVWVVAQKR